MSAIIPIGVVVALMLTAITAVIFLPPPGQHARPRGDTIDVYERTLPALPAPQGPWQPRACPDVPRAAIEPLRLLQAQRHPCYQYASRLAAMSWQSHRTLQRSYDMLAFATVASSYYRMGASYGG